VFSGGLIQPAAEYSHAFFFTGRAATLFNLHLLVGRGFVAEGVLSHCRICCKGCTIATA
jgi:hypothetical protein